ncbi:hypothetical protein [Thalassospira povalilytica]|uniref:hypothetical protein n=1 Tax=Thalassospira povalilytica TaxID=732237 RepID=UPI001D18EB8F|nr:hypothetical protein [Thalassospira povalilytica]MCC4239843.1 hypothetical protein [Thalassospira povalilytica]
MEAALRLESLQEVDYIPFAELSKSAKGELSREFCRHYRLKEDLVLQRTDLPISRALTKQSGYRFQIWSECLLNGLSVREANQAIKDGKYNNPELDADIVLAIYRGYLRLASPQK